MDERQEMAIWWSRQQAAAILEFGPFAGSEAQLMAFSNGSILPGGVKG
jgi:hypothetical protein